MRAPWIAARRRVELARASKARRAAGGLALIAALTISHTRHDGLRTPRPTFLAAVKELQSARPWTGPRGAYGLPGMARGWPLASKAHVLRGIATRCRRVGIARACAKGWGVWFPPYLFPPVGGSLKAWPCL